jgi:tetratricopeptide (TPR) repeat protein
LETTIAYAEALMLAGRRDTAAGLLNERLPDGVLSLDGAGFLISAGFSGTQGERLEEALASQPSPWLALHWLDGVSAQKGNLAEPIERVLRIPGVSRLAAVAAVRVSLESGDVAAIGSALKFAKDIPPPIRRYAIARIRWAQGQKSEVFDMWPDGFPDFRKLAETGELGEWAAALSIPQAEEFFAGVDGGLSPLQAPPDAELDELRALAGRLMEDETINEFGGRKVRDALVETALALSHDPESSERVLRMVDLALLSGADPVRCLRAEARAYMSRGDFTAAYARWLRLLETQPDALIADDFLEAAHCVLEDDHDEPAMMLLARGSERFPEDSSYALNSAWLALATGHPENAALLLERGFDVGFAEQERETATALRACIAERNGHPELADAFFQELASLSDDWRKADIVLALEWPELIQAPFLEIQERNSLPLPEE